MPRRGGDRDRGGGGRGGGKGRGGGGGGLPREVSISKALSYVLRHAAEREGVKIDSQGYANVAELLKWRKLQSLKVTLPDILTAVETSDKKRFGLVHVPPKAEATKEEEPTSTPETQQTTSDQTSTETSTEPTSKEPTTTERTSTEPTSKEPTTTEPTSKEPTSKEPTSKEPTTTETTTTEPTTTTQPPPTETATETTTALALAANDPEPSHYLIRATQGHSIKTIDVASLLQKLTLSDKDDTTSPPLPDTVVHGTYHAAWPSIVASGGLKCMGRNQIHFATGPSLESVLPDRSGSKGDKDKDKGEGEVSKAPPDKTVISGMRADAQILIYIDLRRAMEAGCPFWRSENDVILSEGDAEKRVVGMEFFDVVVERAKGLGVLWEGGKVVQELPGELVGARNPKGGRRGGGRRGGKGKGNGNGAPRVKVEGDTEVVD
ncbi:tRNA 2'-phosphotransferase 1 [Arachnomyces sp. PD_36]|nr:tRNA 2'-phosphotransferase 1 [Arachnomyces sp. PD_36]